MTEELILIRESYRRREGEKLVCVPDAYRCPCGRVLVLVGKDSGAAHGSHWTCECGRGWWWDGNLLHGPTDLERD